MDTLTLIVGAAVALILTFSWGYVMGRAAGHWEGFREGSEQE